MIIEMIQEGGIGSYGAIALGGLGFVLGCLSLVALLGGSRAAFSLGVAALLVGAAAAGAGMLGTVYGRHQVAAAVAYVSPTDKDRILHQGLREAQSSSLIGFFAALLPLVLGGAGAVLGSRLARPKSRVQGFAQPVVSSDEGSPQTIIAALFLGMSAIACGGAWAMAHAELPKLRFELDDSDGWALAAAIDDVKANQRPEVCERLSEALRRFWDTADNRQWPRKMKPMSAELAGWRAAADTCTENILNNLDDDSPEQKWTRDALLDSPLLQDDTLHTRLLAWAPREADEPDQPQGSLGKEAIQTGIRKQLKAIRSCYERELVKNPALGGKLIVQFTVGADGSVTTAQDASTEPFPSTKVADCVLNRFKAMQFPKPAGGGVVSVKYPLVFKANE